MANSRYTNQDFRYSEGLVMLRHVDSGMDIISDMTDDVSAIKSYT